MSRPRAIRPVSSREENFLRLMIYGEPGTGKSVLAGTSGPKTLILCNNSDETSSAAIAGSEALQWTVQDYTDLLEAFEWLRHEGVPSGEIDFIWLDNATLFQEQGMDQIMEETVARSPHRSIYKPDKPEYGENQNRLSRIIRDFKGLPVHLGLTAHVMRMDDEGKTIHMPDFQGGQGKFSQKLCGYMGVVGYLYVTVKDGKKIRRLRLDKTATFYAKDRYASTLKGVMDNPTIPLLMKGIEAKFPSLGAKPRPVKRTAKKSTTRTRSS